MYDLDERKAVCKSGGSKMIKPVICFEMLFDGEAPERKVEKIAAAGFEYVEFWAWRDKDIEKLKKSCLANHIKVANFSGQRVGDLVNPATHEKLLADYEDAKQVAEILGTKTLMVLTNELGEEGIVVHSYPEIDAEKKREAVISGLKKLSKQTPKDFTLVLEPLNTLKDHLGYFVNNLKDASEILAEVGDPRIKILCDLYHQGMMGDDPLELIEKYIGNIGYIHIADYPGRHEPGTGTADWKEILIAIKRSGYDGFVGFEYAPAGDSKKSLAIIKEYWDSVF
jgi:hydroxypyruvate isomerase